MLERARLHHVGFGKKIRIRWAGTERGEGDAGIFEFRGERFAERKNEGFCRVIDREERARLKARNRRGVKDAATLAREHRRKKQFRQSKNRFDIEPDHREILLDRDFLELAALSVAGVVYQDIDFDSALLQLVENFLGSVFLFQVFCDHDRLRCAFLQQPSRDVLQFRFHRRDQHHRVTVPRELFRQVQSNAAR